MNGIRWTVLAALLLAVGLVPACGGGGGGVLDGGGIGGTGLRIGPNQGNGAVKVAGVAFDTTAATITLRGGSATAADVQDGMVVVVEGSVTGNTGTASRVEIEDVLEGSIQQKLDASTMVVLGQMAQVDDTTTYGPGISPASLDGLLVGDPVRLYGFVRNSGVVFATRVERLASLGELSAKGIVEGLDTSAQTFRIGTQAVDYSGADTTDLPGGVPANGQLVEVKGLSQLSPQGEIVATLIKLEDFDQLDDAAEAEVEGYVTSVTSPTAFVLGGQAVVTDGNTVYVGGIASEVVVGVRLEVKGARQAGVLTATRVVFQAGVKLESDVATRSGNTITLVGLPGLSITVNAATEYEGSATQISDIAAGDHVEIRGNKTGATAVTASRVKETSANTDVILQGPVDASPAPSDPSFSILGIAVDTTGLADADFRDADEQQLGRSTFFTQLIAGVLVEAQGSLSGSTVTWNEMEFEGEDD